jgi:hypothetical protein
VKRTHQSTHNLLARGSMRSPYWKAQMTKSAEAWYKGRIIERALERGARVRVKDLLFYLRDCVGNPVTKSIVDEIEALAERRAGNPARLSVRDVRFRELVAQRA